MCVAFKITILNVIIILRLDQTVSMLQLISADFFRLSDDLRWVEMFDTVFCFSTGRFDETVIEERRQSAVNLLKFVGGHHYLYNSKDFKAFIKVWIHSTLYRSKELKDFIKVEIQTTLYKSKVLKAFIMVGIPNIVLIWGAYSFHVG